MPREPWRGLPIEIVLEIAERDHWTCQVGGCGDGYRSWDPWEVDHDVARVNGGTDAMSNLRLAHQSCNNAKGAA